MLHNKDDVAPGDGVFLTPRTKQAPRICYSRPPATVISTDPWPYVTVAIMGVAGETDIHKDNINKRQTKTHASKGEGDGVQEHEAAATLPADQGRDHDGWQEPTLL